MGIEPWSPAIMEDALTQSIYNVASRILPYLIIIACIFLSQPPFPFTIQYDLNDKVYYIPPLYPTSNTPCGFPFGLQISGFMDIKQYFLTE